MHAKPKGGGDLNFECEGGQMTALHLFAQQLLVGEKALTLPAVAGGVGKERIVHREVDVWEFECAEMEQVVGAIRPDVILSNKTSKLHVEIVVTNPCSPEKEEAVRAAGHAMVEIDLSTTDRDTKLPGLKDWILHGADRRWIYNRHIEKIEAKIVAQREKRYRAEVEHEKRRRERAVADLKAAYRDADSSALADDPRKDPLTRRADEGGWKDLISGFPALAPGLLSIHPERWRSIILLSILDDSFGQSSSLMAAALERAGVVNEVVQRHLLMTSVDSALARLPATDTTAVVEDYLRFLERAGAARCVGERWTRSLSLQCRIREQETREAVQKAEAAERRSRIDRLVRVLDDIGFGLQSVADFSDQEQAWRDAPLWGSTPLGIAQAGGDHWEELERALTAILNCMRDGAPDPPPPTLGLPQVAEAMESGIAAKHQRAANERDRVQRQAEAKIEEEARRIEQRAADIRSEAIDSLGGEAGEWLSTYLVQYKASPEELARRSDTALSRARGALRDAVALQKRAGTIRSHSKHKW